VHCIADNYASHKHPKVRAGLTERPRRHMHFVPTYSSWLNQLERFFSIGVFTLMAQAANIPQTGRYGDHARTVRQDRALPADAARQRQPEQRASGQRNPLRGRARLQVARTAQALRQLAHDLHAHEPLDEVWRARRMFEELQKAQVVRIKIEAVSLDSTSIKVHPDGTGALKKTARKPSASPEADGTPRFIWLPRMLERP
jgi:hypothetical protein